MSEARFSSVLVIGANSAIAGALVSKLLEKNPNPTEEEIRWGISGNLCRCTGYNNIVKSIIYAGAKLRGDELPSTEPVFVE